MSERDVGRSPEYHDVQLNDRDPKLFRRTIAAHAPLLTGPKRRKLHYRLVVIEQVNINEAKC